MLNRFPVAILLLCTLLNGQDSNIKKIEILSKQNGISINIHSDLKIETSQITGWHNKSTSWSYITLYNTKGNIFSLNNTPIVNTITELEIIQLGESLQLGLRSIKPVENFEFYHEKNDSTIIASLRYPISEALAYIEKSNLEKKEKQERFKFSVAKNKTTLFFIATVIIVGLLIN